MRIIHNIVGGSRLYGFATPSSDVDVRGVCLSPMAALLGLKKFEQYQVNSESDDIVFYELRKFCNLALGTNPNILDILFAPASHWRISTTDWISIYRIRRSFLSQRIRRTFGGYANSQLKRIQRHIRWINDPPSDKPHQGHYGAVESEGVWAFPHLSAEKRYESDLKTWSQYQMWLNNRNPKRAELERKYDYDTKNALHLVRLLLQARHILESGDYTPVLSHSDLMTIKDVSSGEWSYDYLLSWANVADCTIRECYSALPDEPDFAKVNDAVIEIYHKYVVYDGVR